MAFLYLGRTVTFNKSDWGSPYQNFHIARCWWEVVAKLLTSTGVTVCVGEMLYKAVLQMVLIYVRESWVVMGAMLKFMEGFHHQEDRRISGNMDQRTLGVEWQWPPVADALEISSLWPIKEYIQRQQATITEHIYYRPIYELCICTEKMPRSSLFMRWWDQDVGWEVE